MSQSQEKTKRKAKPRIDRYSQMEAVLVIMMMLAVTLFLWLDELIGAVALKHYEGYAALGVTAIVPFLYFHFLGRWGYMHHHWAWFYAILASVSAVFLFVPYVFLGILGFYSGDGISCLPGLFFVLALFTIVGMAKPSKPMSTRRFAIERGTFAALVFGLILSLAGIERHGNTSYSNLDQMHVNGHDYHLLSQVVSDTHGWDGISNYIALYECKMPSIYCETIEVQSVWGSIYGDVGLIEGDHNNILIVHEDRVLFDSDNPSP